MNTLRKVSLRWRLAGNMVLFGLMTLAGTSSPAFGQSALQGEVNLSVEARFGNTVLAPGAYKFVVRPVGISQTINTNPGASNQVLVSLTGLAKGTPITSVLGWATQQDAPASDKQYIRMDETGNTFQYMYLDNVGMLIELRENKPKNPMHARTPEIPRAANTAKGV